MNTPDLTKNEHSGMSFEKTDTEMVDAVLNSADAPSRISAYRQSIENREMSRQELQAFNEEPVEVNQELEINIEQFSQSNNDFINLLNSIGIGAIFLDRNRRVKMFTPSVLEVFDLSDADLNRPLDDETLAGDVQHAIETLQASEREIITERGKCFLMRISPYRTAENHISGGVIIVLIDITKRQKTEKDLRESERRMRILIESATDYAIFTMSEDGTINSWNFGAEKIFGYTESEIIGKKSAILFTKKDVINQEPEHELQDARRTGRGEDERWHIRKDGSKFFASGVVTPLSDAEGSGFVKIARDMTEKMLAEKALRDKEILQRLVSAQEDERKRIARDLHDHLGQQLTALRLQLEAVRKACDDEELCLRIDKTQEIARNIDADVDFLAWELRPAALDDLGLISALDNFIREWSIHTNIAADFLASNLKNLRFAPEIETNLYRITQEALNNISKHAQAASVNVLLEVRGALIALIIEDNGVGFDADEKNVRNKGIGLLGMEERAALIGGKIKIESAENSGTTIFVRIPIEGNIFQE